MKRIYGSSTKSNEFINVSIPNSCYILEHETVIINQFAMSSDNTASTCSLPAHLILNASGIPIDPLNGQVITVGNRRYKFDAYRNKWYVDNDWDRVRLRNAVFREKRQQGFGTKEAWRDAFTVYPPTFEDPNTGKPYVVLEN